jgi:hypothetical protein
MHPDADPDPAIFSIDLQDINKNQFFLCFFAYYFLKVRFHHFQIQKVIKKSTDGKNLCFFKIFAG